MELEGTRIKAESSPRKGAAPAMGCDVSALDAGSKSGESEKKLSGAAGGAGKSVRDAVLTAEQAGVILGRARK